MSPSGMAPQLTETNGPSRRGPSWWIAWATSSFPVPLSPVIMTVEVESAALRIMASTSSIAELRPTNFANPRSRANSRRRARFSSCRRFRSSAFSTVSRISSSLKGLVR